MSFLKTSDLKMNVTFLVELISSRANSYVFLGRALNVLVISFLLHTAFITYFSSVKWQSICGGELVLSILLLSSFEEEGVLMRV